MTGRSPCTPSAPRARRTPDLGGQRLEPQASRLRAERPDTRAVMTAEPSAVCDQQTRRGPRPGSRGMQVWGATDRRPLPARRPVDDHAQCAPADEDSASGIVDACGAKSPDSHRVVWGLTSRPPVHPGALPPVSRLPAGFFSFLRRPLVSLRPASSGSSPSAVARFRFPAGIPAGSFPLSNLHAGAAAGRSRRRWSLAGRDQGHQ